MYANEKNKMNTDSVVESTSACTGLKEEPFDLEKIKDELLSEEQELEEYRLYSKIALAGLWLSFILVALGFIKTT